MIRNVASWMAVLISCSAAASIGCSGDTDAPPTGPVDSGSEAAASDSGDAGTDVSVDAGPDVTTCAAVVDSGVSFGSSTCDSCMGQSCCDDVTNCLTDVECSALLQCTRACDGGTECRNGCKAAHSDGIAAASAVITCSSSACPGMGCDPLL